MWGRTFWGDEDGIEGSGLGDESIHLERQGFVILGFIFRICFDGLSGKRWKAMTVDEMELHKMTSTCFLYEHKKLMVQENFHEGSLEIQILAV